LNTRMLEAGNRSIGQDFGQSRWALHRPAELGVISPARPPPQKVGTTDRSPAFSRKVHYFLRMGKTIMAQPSPLSALRTANEVAVVIEAGLEAESFLNTKG
jgi:hypothetical protein